jgi:thioredoxin-like negative regulator of GroEL
MWWLWLSVAWAVEPGANLTWRGAEGRLWVRPAQGEHVAPEGPVDVELQVGTRTVVAAGVGADLAHGLSLGELRGATVSGEVHVTLCEDGGTRCRFVEFSVWGEVLATRRGELALTVGPVSAGDGVEGDGFPAKVDAAAVHAAAVSDAERTKRPILLDFGAVWCPPCNLMSAEIFGARPRPSVVDAFVLAEIDVDDPSSWPLKDRYEVGGYPTLLAIDAAGNEIGRLVGYRGVDPTVQWMDDVITGRALRPVDAPSAEQAAALAWQAVRDGRTAKVSEWMDLAKVEPEQREFRLARFTLGPNVEDARWLIEHAPGSAIEWVAAGQRAAADDPALRSALLDALRVDLATASALDAADLLSFVAEIEGGDHAPVIYAAAAALVRTRLTGEPAADKGHLGWLAYLTEHAGDVKGAIALLEQARAAWPAEPTFHVSLARLYLRRGFHAEALAVSERAVETAWGDNLLTAATLKVEALLALGRAEEARGFVHEVLGGLPAPDASLDVRSHRMREKLLGLVAP